jgi:hypothetical protein
MRAEVSMATAIGRTHGVTVQKHLSADFAAGVVVQVAADTVYGLL